MIPSSNNVYDQKCIAIAGAYSEYMKDIPR